MNLIENYLPKKVKIRDGHDKGKIGLWIQTIAAQSSLYAIIVLENGKTAKYNISHNAFTVLNPLNEVSENSPESA